jgi:16S rRNA (cytosine1402-N4)-methyltransferase
MSIQEMLSFNHSVDSQVIETRSFEKTSYEDCVYDNSNALVHIPIMTKEIIEALNVRDGGFYIDCTFGEGGHTRAILERGAFVLAIDRDKEAIENCDKLKREFPDTFFTKHASFSQLDEIWEDKIAPMKADGVIMDLGFSSKQIESKERGFAFKYNANLDMRFDLNQEMSAHTWINKASKEEMAQVFFNYGQEKNCEKIAKEIIKFRKKQPLNTTFQLIEIIG